MISRMFYLMPVHRTLCLLVPIAVIVVFACAVSSAFAVDGGSQWTVSSVSRPTNFAPGDEMGDDGYVVTVTNTGGVAAGCTMARYESESASYVKENGGNPDAIPPVCPEDSPAVSVPITITDELPEGLSLASAGASGEDLLLGDVDQSLGAKLSCVLRTCEYTGVVVPDDSLILRIPVDVLVKAPSSVTNVVHVSGGGAPDAVMETPTSISSTPAGFGISGGGASTALSSTQAGAHSDLTTSIAFNTVNAEGTLAGAVKDTTDDLPPGFAGDLIDTSECAPAAFNREECPTASQVGVVTVKLFRRGISAVAESESDPVYNLSPNPGELARLGFVLYSEFGIQGEVSLLPGDYGLQTTFHNTDESSIELDSVSLTVWGVPEDPIHDTWRWHGSKRLAGSGFGAASGAALAPFLTNPTSCGTVPLEATFTSDSWEEPVNKLSTGMKFGPIVGCDRLVMEPSLSAEPTTPSAYSPTGLDLTMGVPQTYNNAEGLATPTLEGAVVTLPEGMTVNPSAGAGLAACTEAEYAEEGAQFVAGRGCPKESKLGEVRIKTPALSEEAEGSVYLAAPYENPFSEPSHPGGSLLALYIVARIPNRGVIVKAAGQVSANAFTGQLVTTFDTANAKADSGLPPLPFSLFTFKFSGGAASPLVTPSACGEYTVEAQLTPASSVEPLATLVAPPFAITSGFGGGSCPAGGVPPFEPQVIAGTNNNAAGSYSPFYIRIVRNDGEQEITGFSSQLPPGLTADLTGVPFCSEEDIALARIQTGAQEEAEPACPAASEIGHTLAGVGVGSVLAYTPGKIYMAGQFEGAPFSIVAVTSAKVGPFDLGTVVVHLPLQINPQTAVVSVPPGPADQIPHIIHGIVVHVRDIRVYIDRPSFTLNPTNCDPMSISATVIGSGANYANTADQDPVTVSDLFQAANCASLAFKPGFKVSTSGKTSRADGASLTATLTYPKAAQGTQANIRSVKVDLPKQLPSRLTTLQKACTAAQFALNHAGCPAASIVGHAKAITPILPVALEGPAYFVSHGGAKFPELVIVLQGYGVTIELHGETFISKAGITSSTFRTIPDEPVGSFQIMLSEGRYSALAANGNLCKSKLAMPTAFTAQNGMTIHESTKISVTGCAKKTKKNNKKPTKKTHGSGKHGKGTNKAKS